MKQRRGASKTAGNEAVLKGEARGARIYKGIYLEPEICAAMQRLKAENGVSFSFQVNKAMRGYLGMDH